MSAHLRLRELSIRFNDRTPPVLTGVNLSVGAGECHCIVGPTGSGKSSLLLAAAGLLPPEALNGAMERTGRAGTVFQNPGTQILFDHVGPETAFALENAGVDPAAMPDKVARALAEADLPVPTHTPTSSLSMGRQYRLVLAGALVTEPGLLLLDEPCAQLDPDGCRAVAGVVDAVLKRGGGVLLCEHRPDPLAAHITHWWRIEDHGLRPSEPVLAPAPPPRAANRPTDGTGPALLEVWDLSLRRGDHQVFSGLDLTIRPGEAVHVEGGNGSGKSTLTRILAGFLAPDAGTATLFDQPVAPARLRGRVGLVLQSPSSQLFEDTVLRELAYAARRKGLDDPEGRARCAAKALGISDLLDRAPFLLSYGQQRLTALGACLTQEPDLLLLDDPFAGLDREARERVHGVLDAERARRGMAVLVTGHNPTSSLRFADFYTRELRISGGRLEPVA
ncbi:ABC transporter related protein [Pseudodesulfovibrio mercurii]|uniref:ABC transporter related protein n=1 Tax=Pseudodesulfovibrio mercurii TaxID=641491 RepID=F0JDT9_9BACT|nr:ABC transporter ATP-binding protein [Pseudodesulfovibrio mercurii]EGB14621.1 ABC transporter related protein [Pseudodesulfovibrio mercurii]